MPNNKVATIKPSEHVELIIERVYRVASEASSHGEFLRVKVAEELERIKAWLEERGE